MALRRPAPRPARRRFFAVREDHDGRRARPVNTIVAIPLDGGDPRVLVSGPGLRRRAAAVAGRRRASPGSSGTTRTCPGTRPGCASPRSSPTARSASRRWPRAGPDESIVQPEWSPDGTLHLVSDRSGWWNLYRLVEGPRLEPLAPMEAEFADPAWLFDRSSYGFLPDGSIVAVARRGRPRPPLPDRARAPARRGRDRRSPSSTRCASAPHAVVAHRRRPERPVGRRPARPGDPGPGRRPAPGEHGHARPGGDRRSPSRSSSRRPATGPRTRSTTRRPTRLRRPGRRAAAARRPVPRRPDLERLDRARPQQAVPDQPRHRGRRRRLRRQHRLRPRVPPAARRRSGASSTSTTASRRPGSSSSVATSTASGWRSRAAAPAATRRSRRSPSATSSRPGISHFGDRRPRARSRRDTHKFESRYDDRLVGPYPEAAALYRERSPIHSVDRISCPVLVLQGLDDRVVPPAQAEAIVAALAANGIPHAYLAFEGEGHGFRGAVRHPAHASRPAVVPRPGLRVRARPTRSSRSRSPGSTPGASAPRAPPPAASRPPAEAVDSPPDGASARSSSSSACSSSPSRSAYVARRIGIAYPILLCSAGSSSGYAARACRRSSSSPNSSSCSSCRRSCSGPATSRRSATSRPTPGRSGCWRSGSCCSRRSSSGWSPRPLIPGMPAARGVRPRGDRRAARRGRGDVHLPAARRAAPGRHDPRGREPRSTTRRRSSPTGSRSPSALERRRSRSPRPASTFVVVGVGGIVVGRRRRAAC